jgi:hypothetical protein
MRSGFSANFGNAPARRISLRASAIERPSRAANSAAASICSEQSKYSESFAIRRRRAESVRWFGVRTKVYRQIFLQTLERRVDKNDMPVLQVSA